MKTILSILDEIMVKFMVVVWFAFMTMLIFGDTVAARFFLTILIAVVVPVAMIIHAEKESRDNYT